MRLVISMVLLALACWSIKVAWPLRIVHQGNFAFTEEESRRFENYADAQYAYGMRSWMDQNPQTAAGFYRQAVSHNVLHVDAWLRLAEAEAALGREGNARSILVFTARMTDRVLRWKWAQMMLALQLNMDPFFCRNANDLLTHKVLERDTLQLLHTHFNSDSQAVIAFLDPQHLAGYLDWLIGWGMAKESQTVWRTMTAQCTAPTDTALRYAHFLIGHKRIRSALDIWQQYTNPTSALTNPGFETRITGQGFDWRRQDEKNGQWEIKRVFSESAEGNYALQIRFAGKANIVFHHLYQIVAAAPMQRYRLTYRWKTRGITTDQGPFVEIVGYDGKGLQQNGPMMRGTRGWRQEAIDFTMPMDCYAAVIRLRRRKSMRFDSKIRGRLWVDDFRLEKIHNDPQEKPAAEMVRLSSLKRQVSH